MNIRNLKNEQQLKRTPSSTMNSNKGAFFANQTRSIFTKLSSSSSSSVTSSSSIGSMCNSQAPLINPFEETNRFRLEHSVLSPNLFHVANTSTPERDTTSLWNIDQRAVLYPADIPIDESSLMAQYAYDYKLSKQVIPAVEAFWTENKIIIESPLTGTTGSALRAKFAPMFNNNGNTNSSTKKNKFGKANSVNSPLTNELYNNFSSKKLNAIDVIVNKNTGSKLNVNNSATIHSSSTVTTTYIAKSKRDQVCQTNLCIPTDFDLSKIPELRQFILNDEQINELSPLKKEAQLNNSIRKKLFDHNSEDSSTATTTTTHTQSALLTKLKSADLSSFKQQQIEQSKRISQLPKPEIYSSSDNDNPNNNNNNNKQRTLASSSSSNTDDCLRDSFELDDHQFASSPKYEKYSNIIHDIGGDFGCDDELSDSVFLTQHHKTPPDLSPLLMEGERNSEKSKAKINHDINSPKLNNSKLHFNFEPISSASKKNEKVLSSPNLSPIRQQHESTNCTLKTSTNKNKSSANKLKNKVTKLIESDDLLVNMSSSSQIGAKSIIFMDTEAANELHDESKENKSFSESINGHEHHNHYKREEFYKQISFNETENQNNNETYRNNLSINDDDNLRINKPTSKLATKNISIHKPNLQSQMSSGSTSSSGSNGNISGKPFLLTTMNSMMSETTTNTFNQDSQDTGYQTNSVVNGSNGNTTTNTNINTGHPSVMIMDMTSNNMNELTNNYMFLSSTSTSLSTSHHRFASKPINQTTNTVISSTPMNIEDDNQNKENGPKSATKRPSLDLKKNTDKSRNKNYKIKKNSISLNSLENITPLEASTPDILKYSFNSKSSFKPIVSSSSIWTNYNSASDLKKKVNFVKSKTTNFNLLRNKNQLNNPDPVVVVSSNEYNDVSMSSNNTSNLMFYSENTTKLNDDLLMRKNELDSLYVEQSISMNKLSPSDYARTVLQKAKHDLKESIKFTTTTDTPETNLKKVIS